jgi:predicted DsbA family dithiol-disulfide isomerase
MDSTRRRRYPGENDKEASMPEPLAIDVVSDVVCPWCFLGKRRLDAAIAQAGAAQVRWRPYQLDPTIPPGGLDRKAYMSAKFRDEARLAEVHSRLKALGLQAGIAFDFEAIRLAPNTLDAHRLIRFAAQAGRADEVVERLFCAYFERGQDIGDRAVLTEIGAGLDDIEARLASEEGVAEVQAEIAFAQRGGVEGVPFFIFAQKYAVSGAQSVEALAQAISEARA